VAWNSKFKIVKQRNTPMQHTAQHIAAMTAITTSEERGVV
jgi:hypothetical protein